jgi:SNF2 family DNA or RNA helicase
MGGYMGKQVVGLAKETQVELYKKIRPFYLQRRKKEALDLPPVTLTPRFVPLDKTTWKIYVDMRDELIAILKDGPGDQKILTASNAGVKLVRLMEITAGQVEEHVVGSEKIDDTLDYLAERQEGRLIIWTWFRVETKRVTQALNVVENRSVGMLIGGMSQHNREAVLHQFNDDPNGILVSQLAAGGMGLNMQRASNMLFLSRAYSLLMRIQAIGRIDRMGQAAESVSVVDSIATGPKGEPTVDRAVLKALKRKAELANWTRGEWLKVLQEEKTAALRSKDLFDASDLQ